jgi:hypothetical protein
VIEVLVNDLELMWIEMVRVALSEETVDARIRAIENVKFNVRAIPATSLSDDKRQMNSDDPRFVASLLQVAKTSQRMSDAAYEMAQTEQRYVAKNERKLNIAEQICKRVLLSIADEKFAGLHTEIGILQEVQDEARKHGTSGAKDKDVLRNIWSTYRGVVHLGVAMKFYEGNPEDEMKVLHLAEEFRQILSENCPKGTTKPYVSSGDQFKFTYNSMS